MSSERATIVPNSRSHPNFFIAHRASFIVLGMLIGLAIFYRGSYQLPVSAMGLAIFCALALWRPDLGLLFVPLTVPLYFMPKGIWDERFGIRPEGVRFPLHEVVLLVVLGATVLHLLVQHAHGKQRLSTAIGHVRAAFSLYRLPLALFLLAGTIGLFIAPATGRGAALREWRWLIVEPLMFFGLVLYYRQRAGNQEPGAENWESGTRNREPGIGALSAGAGFWVLGSFLIGGAFVGLVGMLQFIGLNLAPLIGDKVGFSADQFFVQGVWRVTSVYGHPNNLGLYLGRVWPVAAALLIFHGRLWVLDLKSNAQQAGGLQPRSIRNPSWSLLLYAVCGALALGGLIVSFSRGALLGALAALLVLGALVIKAERTGQQAKRNAVTFLVYLVPFTVVLFIILALVFGIERFNLFGESSAIRLKTWESALAMLRDHPLLGIGLDQFGQLYPRYIDPGLVGTSEIHTAHPHNLLLDIALRMGLLGLFAFGWLIVRFYRTVALGDRRLPDQAATLKPRSLITYLHIGLAAAMTAALVHGLVDSFYFWPDLAFTFWLMLALAHFVPES